MSRIKSVLIVYIFPILGVLGVTYGCNRVNNTNMQLCKHQYALCTSAICVPQPNDPTKAICFCDVEEGPSMSTVPCNTIQPGMDANGIRTLYSSFSLEQFNEGKRGMKCPEGTPWTRCLNKQCTVDPSNSTRAICVCDVVRSGEWMTLGGNCDTSTCQTGYWSGAATKDFDQGNVFLTKVLALDKSPAKWCQAVSL